MNIRLLKSLILMPLMFGCQVGSEIITPDTEDGEVSDFTCVLSSESVNFSHAYDYEPYALNVEVGEEAVVVDLTDAPWVEIKDDVDLIYPDSKIDLMVVPTEPNYSQSSRTGKIVLRGKYTGHSVEVTVNQVGSYQDEANSKSNVWILNQDLVSAENKNWQNWLSTGVLTANQGDMNGILSLEHSVNSPVEILQDEFRGTFKGFDVGDAILLRAPAKNMEAETAITAMVNLSQKSSGVECEWLAEYWAAGKWNAGTSYKTSKAGEDFTYSSLICDFVLAEPVVNDYIKVRFRKRSGSGIVTNFIAADPLVGASLMVTEPAKPLVLTIDFSSKWPFNEITDAGNPTYDPGKDGTTKDKDMGSYILTQDDIEYAVEIYEPGYGYYFNGSALRFENQSDSKGAGGYVKFPAIEGRTLIELSVSITNASAKNISVSTDGSDKGDILPSSKINSKSSATWSVKGKTQENTSYYLNAKGSKTQIGKIVLTYK